MLTEAQKRAQTVHDEKRRARGDRKVSLWLSAESVAVLARKKAAGLSQEQAVNAAILAPDRKPPKPDTITIVGPALPGKAPAVPYGSRLDKTTIGRKR